MIKYTLGFYGNKAAIFKNNRRMTTKNILAELNEQPDTVAVPRELLTGLMQDANDKFNSYRSTLEASQAAEALRTLKRAEQAKALLENKL